MGKNEEFPKKSTGIIPPEKRIHSKKMQSLIAVACKLIRVFHAILTKGIRYDASKMLKDIRHPGRTVKGCVTE